jgi:hypothetical protein
MVSSPATSETPRTIPVINFAFVGVAFLLAWYNISHVRHESLEKPTDGIVPRTGGTTKLQIRQIRLVSRKGSP